MSSRAEVEATAAARAMESKQESMVQNEINWANTEASLKEEASAVVTAAGAGAAVRDAAFSASARLVVTLSGRNAITVFDSYGGSRLHAIKDGSGTPFLQTLALSPDHHEEEAGAMWVLALGLTRLNEAVLIAQELGAVGVSREEGAEGF